MGEILRVCRCLNDSAINGWFGETWLMEVGFITESYRSFVYSNLKLKIVKSQQKLFSSRWCTLIAGCEKQHSRSYCRSCTGIAFSVSLRNRQRPTDEICGRFYLYFYALFSVLLDFIFVVSFCREDGCWRWVPESNCVLGFTWYWCPDIHRVALLFCIFTTFFMTLSLWKKTRK